MRNRKYARFITTVLAVAMLSVSQCKKEIKIVGEPAIEKLPEATQQGKNTFGCSINGAVWLSKRNPNNFISRNQFLFGIYPSEKTIRIQANKLDISPAESIILFSDNINSVGTYNLKIDRSELYTSYNSAGNSYLISDTINSNLTITRYDTINQIISGTFNFKFLKNNVSNSIDDGVFDLKY